MHEAIKNTEDVLKVRDKLKQIVSFFHHSVEAINKLTQLQEQHNQPAKKTNSRCGDKMELNILYV